MGVSYPILRSFYVLLILFELFKRTLFLIKILRKFYANFDTFESHENYYIEIFSHAEHDSGPSFLITIISNLISPCKSLYINGYNAYVT